MPVTTIERPKFFSVEEANARIPLLRCILRDVTELSHELKGMHERLIRLQTSGAADADHERDIAQLAAEMDCRHERMRGYESELAQLGAVLKDDFLGLVDFPTWMDGREVCLCYQLGETEIAHWHEVDAGYGGRRPIKTLSRPRGFR
jgi:hypothetical protein